MKKSTSLLNLEAIMEHLKSGKAMEPSLMVSTKDDGIGSWVSSRHLREAVKRGDIVVNRKGKGMRKACFAEVSLNV